MVNDDIDPEVEDPFQHGHSIDNSDVPTFDGVDNPLEPVPYVSDHDQHGKAPYEPDSQPEVCDPAADQSRGQLEVIHEQWARRMKTWMNFTTWHCLQDAQDAMAFITALRKALLNDTFARLPPEALNRLQNPPHALPDITDPDLLLSLKLFFA
ncbi:uncharacterized protein EDB91DRAFT_1252639 [Suillus paluster]|uniref:uncharacterized protein n=1 Tax=Suillus paluster TaxID=48578 RepID=UPI001B886D00|nr:uncharacterized protein EDB91DRAFT_1252639 [Suillus paluster]KAG1730372.1 hypothetical protein EDB91DRAFT_1252639 [Suillus paluster]